MEHNGPELSQVRGAGRVLATPRYIRAAPVAPERPRSRPSISEVGRVGTRESPGSAGDASMVTKARRERTRPERLTAAARSGLRNSLRGSFVRGSVYARPAQCRLGAGNREAVESGAEPGLWGRAQRFRREGLRGGVSQSASLKA